MQRFLLACLSGALSGFILVVSTGILHAGSSSSLFEMVDSGVKNMSLLFLLALFVVGLIWGLVLKWPNSFGAAICQLVTLPAFAVIEMVKDPTSHNLWPFEFMIYAVLSLFSLLGMSVGLGVKRIWKARVTQ
jgi:uncharacterized membrane protein